ncbi:MAG: 6-bladed beta-propeller, partial [Gemmatimonadota bacterium]
AVERADSAGIEIVVNRGPDVPLDWSFDSLRSIGGADADADVVAQVQTGGVATDATGRLYIMDGMNMHVAVFGPDGELVRTMGREGGGPGEFAMPYSLDVWDGRVAVLDGMHGAVIRFDSAGTPLDRVRLERSNPRPGLSQGPYGIAFPWYEYRVEEATSHQRLVVADSADRTELVAMPEPTPAMSELESCGVSIPVGPIFAPMLVWDGTADAIAANTEPAYVVDVYDGHERVRSIRRDLPVHEVSRADALEAYADGFTIRLGGSPCTVPAEELVDARGFAPELQTVSRIRLSPSTGEFWVQRRSLRHDDGPIDVFDDDGVYIGTLPPGTPFPEAFIGDERIAAIATDELDVRRVVVYRVGRS